MGSIPAAAVNAHSALRVSRSLQLGGLTTLHSTAGKVAKAEDAAQCSSNVVQAKNPGQSGNKLAQAEGMSLLPAGEPLKGMQCCWQVRPNLILWHLCPGMHTT